MRFVILHYHILKNAGSTIENILDHSFGAKFSRFDTPDREGVVSHGALLSLLERNPQLKAVSSHHLRYPVPAVKGFLFFDLCFLRDPLDRIRSMYDYFRKRPASGDPVSELANHAALGDFIAGVVERYPLWVTDVQVNLLACGGNSDRPEEKDLALAIERVRKASFPGVVDCFNQSVIAGQHALACVFPGLDCAQAPVNVSDGLGGPVAARIAKLREACGERVYAELLRLNALDSKLVEVAREEVARRFELVPNREARLRALEERISSGPVRSTAPFDEPEPPRPPAFLSKSAPGAGTRLKRLIKAAPHAGVLRPRAGTLFDPEYYRARYPDVAASGVNPLLHFIMQGAFEGRNPHPLFDTAYYLQKYPEVAAAHINPLGHYLKYGAARALQPHPLFDAAFYLSRHPDVRSAGINPLLHYLANGAAEGRKPHPLFQPDYYLDCCPEVRRGGTNPLVHFAESAGAASRNPHPLFDCASYLRQHPVATRLAANPLVNYVLEQGA